jgi:hypothetical protein
MLLALASVVFLGSESRGTRDNILLSQIWDFPFRRLLRLEVFDPASTRVKLKVKVRVTLRLTVGQSVSLGVEPRLGLMTRYLLLFDSYGLVSERAALSFVYAAGPRQPSHSGVRVPCDSWPYFTVSNFRLPFSSPPATRRVMVKVFEPASTRVKPLISQSPIATDRQWISKSWCRASSGAHDQIFVALTVTVFSWSVFCMCCWP